MEDKAMDLSVSTAVIEDMAAMAAMEVDGVAAMVDKTVDIKRLPNGKLFTSAKVQENNGTVDINLNIKVKQSAKVREVAEAVQKNVKEKIQSMTGSAVTRVNVVVADVEIEKDI